ncbi:hypothetical protein [Prochlorothrix hollandica]|uniref:hypothetical protein n=1 Tax=Prochlorothrix hollandica TaxID=1223 RepID=UPI0003751B6E|nr:hypothetical protein [Prochlorothrix hollandica]
MQLKSIFSTLTLSLVALGSLGPAIAQTFERDSTGTRVVVSELTPYESYKTTYAIPKTRTVSNNACGFYTLSSTSAYPFTTGHVININGTNQTVGSLTSVVTPRCTDGQIVDNPGNGIYQNSDGKIFVMGGAPYGQITLSYNNIPLVRSSKANSCGHILLSHTTGSYSGYTGALTVRDSTNTTTVGSATVSSLSPGATAICRSGVTYVPAGSNP